LAACASAAPRSVASTAPSRASASQPVSTPPPAAPSCPAQFDSASKPWVPALPTGVDGRTRLAPATVAAAVVVCAYRHADNEALTGSRQLAGDLTPVEDQLSWAPPKVNTAVLPCALYIAAADRDNYLIGLQYQDALVWVWAPGFHCQSSGNGEFVSSANLGAVASGWYDAGRASAAASSASCVNGLGRLGQDVALVPAGASGAQICRVAISSDTLLRTLTAVAAGQLADALNAVPTAKATDACVSGVVGSKLVFTYPSGPPVIVHIRPGCDQVIDNGALQTLAHTDLTRVLRLVAG
jgi:hypothetical protein